MLNGLIGRRETGKTTLAVYLARLESRRLIFDIRNNIFPRGRGLKVYSIDELIDAYALLLAGETDEVIYHPRDGLQDGFAAFSAIVQSYVDRFPRGRLGVVLDESALVEKILEDQEHPFQCAMRHCKRTRVHFFLTCHQPKNLPTNTRAICDYLIFFHCVQEHDLRVIRERCNEAFADQVIKLAPFQYKIWSDKQGIPVSSALASNDWNIDLAEDEPEPLAPIAPANVVDFGNLWR